MAPWSSAVRIGSVGVVAGGQTEPSLMEQEWSIRSVILNEMGLRAMRLSESQLWEAEQTLALISWLARPLLGPVAPRADSLEPAPQASGLPLGLGSDSCRPAMGFDPG
jgi:hypothetical protein